MNFEKYEKKGWEINKLNEDDPEEYNPDNLDMVKETGHHWFVVRNIPNWGIIVGPLYDEYNGNAIWFDMSNNDFPHILMDIVDDAEQKNNTSEVVGLIWNRNKNPKQEGCIPTNPIKVCAEKVCDIILEEGTIWI